MMNFLSRKVAVAAIALAFILPAFSPALAQSVDTRGALKEVGVSVLPEFLDAATEHITIRMPAALGGEKLVFGGTIDAGALAEKKFVFTSSEKTPITWKKAFGIPWLTIDGMLMQLTVARGAFDIKLAGKVGGIFGRSLSAMRRARHRRTQDTRFHPVAAQGDAVARQAAGRDETAGRQSDQDNRADNFQKPGRRQDQIQGRHG